MAFGGKMGEEGAYLWLTEVARMAGIMEEDKAANPAGIRLLGTQAVMFKAADGANLIKKPGLWICCAVGRDAGCVQRFLFLIFKMRPLIAPSHRLPRLPPLHEISHVHLNTESNRTSHGSGKTRVVYRNARPISFRN